MEEHNLKGTYEPGSLDEVVGEITEKETSLKDYAFLRKVIRDITPAITGGLAASLFLYYII